MTLAISRDGTRLRVGRRYFKLHPGDGRHGVMLCEGNLHPNGIQFDQIRHIKESEFPRDLELILQPDRTEYSHVAWMSISRLGERICFDLTCDYYFNRWAEPINLRDFFAALVREMTKLRTFTIDQFVERGVYGDDVLALLLSAEFDIGTRLHDRYRGLMRMLQSAHEEALARVVPVASAKMLARPSIRAHLLAVARRERPRAFICHDSRDKSKVAEPIAQRLAALTCPVWYDKFSLQVGDRLRESIEAGLKQAGKCILIISPRFLSNQGWSKMEFDSIFSRELMERKDILLPVWVGVTPRQVFEYSPALANRVGINWSLGLNEVVRQLYAATSRRSRKRVPVDK